jgi:hypothetical protein
VVKTIISESLAQLPGVFTAVLISPSMVKDDKEKREKKSKRKSDSANREFDDEDEIDDAKLDLGDQWGMKRRLDEEAVHCLDKLGYKTDWRLWNAKMGLGFVSCLCAAIAQFWPAEYPANKMVLLVCCGVYYLCGAILQYLTSFRENGWFVFTEPKDGVVWSTSQGIALTSSMERYDYDYTMVIEAVPVCSPFIQCQCVGMCPMCGALCRKMIRRCRKWQWKTSLT